MSQVSSIMVAVRVRPFTEVERNRLVHNHETDQFLGAGALSDSSRTPKLKGLRKIVNVVDDRMLIFDPANENPIQKMQQTLFPKSTTRAKEHKFTFDQLFDEDATQDDVYCRTTKPLIDSILNGYNGTVFAYGATGCGKTYTITGTPDDPGIIYSTTKELFERIETLKETKNVEVSLSFLEIYNETIRDLLCPETEPKLLTLREDTNQRISVRNLSTHKLTTVDEIIDLIVRGNINRTVNATQANAASSRSHAVLQINIDQRDRGGGVNEEHSFATLSIIDLAGSERASATKNSGKRLNEGANINRSLLALGNCINALCDPKSRNHIPYRDSKLTRLLKFSLGGNCKTVMIVCISPSSQHYDETFNALKYANRAKEIKTKVSRNTQNLDRHIGSYLKMITEQKQEIEELRTREKRIVRHHLEAYESKREKCDFKLVEAVDKIRSAIQEDEDLLTRRAKLHVKKRWLIAQKSEMEILLASFKSNYGSKFVDVPRELVGVNNTIEKILAKLGDEMQKIDTVSDFNLDLTKANITLAHLKELDGWTEYNTMVFELLVDSLRESAQREVFSKSDQIWSVIMKERSDITCSSFKFMSGNFFTVLKKLTFINTSGDIDVIHSDNLTLINGVLNEFYEMLNESLQGSSIDSLLRINMNVTPSKWVSSPAKLSMKRLGRNASRKISPIRKPTKPKKVRWDLAANRNIDLVVHEDEELEYEGEGEEEEEGEAEVEVVELEVGEGEEEGDESNMMDTTMVEGSASAENLRFFRLANDKMAESEIEEQDGEVEEDEKLEESEKPQNNTGFESRSSTSMSSKPMESDSDLSRLSIDNSLMLDKENIEYFNNSVNNSMTRDAKVGPKGPRSPTLGAPVLPIPSGKMKIDPIDRFNFETSFDVDMS